MLLDTVKRFPAGASDPAKPEPKPTTNSTRLSPGTVPSAALALPTQPARHPSDRVAGYLRRLMQDHFYGKITLTLRDGRIEVVRTEQSLKLVDVPDTPAAVDGGIA